MTPRFGASARKGGNLDDWDPGLIDALASSAHGFLFQHQREFARDVSAFLDESLSKETRA